MAKKVIKKPSIQDILNGGKSLSNDISNYNSYEPNISTQVNNVIKKKYNINRDKLEEHKTKIGGYYANTTRGKIGTALTALPFAVAAIPALGAAGKAAAPYLAKAAASTAIKPILTTLKNPLVDAGLTAGFAAHGLNHAINEGINDPGDAVMTALEVAPLGRLARPIYNTAVKTGNTLYNDVYVPYKIANTINKGVKENAVITAYNRNPATKDIGSLWDYQYYLDNVFPNSKVKDVLWHGSINKNLQTFSPEYIGSNTPIKESMGMYLTPERATAANYGKGGVYPVLLNTENPFITNQFFGGISKNGVNVTKISPQVKNTLLTNNDAVIAPKRGEIAFFNPDNALILGSDADVTGFKRFMSRPQVLENFLTIKPQVRTRVGDVEVDNPYYQSIRNNYYKYHNKLKSQDDKLNNFKNLININNMINSKKDRKKYAGGGKVPPAAAQIKESIKPTNITNKQDAIKSYKKPIPVDKIRYTPIIGVRIPTDSELRRQKEIESLTPNERYEYRRKEAANERRNNEFKGLLNGLNNTFGRAASLASLIYGGGWAANRLLRGNKATNLGQHLSKYMIPANTVDTYGDAIQFIADPSLSNGVELGAGIVGKKYKDYGKKSRQLFELGIQGLNAYNSYKYGGDVKSTPKRKYENNYIMKGTGNYVPKTPQEKVIVDLYNANYKSARKNMSRENALRQAHYRTTQQALESGYGTSRQAKQQNNYGGMGGGKGFKYKTLVDFTNHVDSTLQSNFNKSYNAPTLNHYINGLYEGRIGNYSETPKDEYGKLLKGTHGRTSRIIEQLNPDDYTLLNNMYNPYGNTNLMYAKYGCKVRPKAWIGAAISAVAGIASSLINANAQKKAAARQARAQEAAENRKYATDLTTQLNNSSADDTQFYDQFKTEFKNGGKVKGYNPRITDGGIAIPIGRDTSLLRGSLHNEINEAGNTGIGIKYGNNEVEAQDGEIVRKKKDKLLVYSDEDELGNGISPAKRVLIGENKDKVFAMQENNKRRKGIVNNNKTFWTGGHMTFTKGDAYGAAANAVGNIASFFINNNAINKMSAGKAPILVSPTKLNTVYNANAQLADINKSRLRMKNAITRNSSSSVAALGRLNDIENSAIDKVNQIYENKNNVESQLMNQDRMNAQSVRLQNAAKMDEYNRRVAEINNQKHLARAQNITSLINGLAGAAEQTINNAEERYYKDKNLEIAAAPYDDETTSKLLEIEGAVPENRIVEIYLRNKDSQDPKKKALAELAFRRMNNFDSSSKYNSYINQEYRNKAKLIGNNGYKVPTLGNINTNIRLNGETPYYTNHLITRMLNRNNEFVSYMNGYRY